MKTFHITNSLVCCSEHIVFMALWINENMNKRRANLSLILPKIDQDHKDVQLVNGRSSPNSKQVSIENKSKVCVNFPSLIDENNNHSARIFKYKQASRNGTRLQRHEDCRLSEKINDTNTHGINSLETKTMTKLDKGGERGSCIDLHEDRVTLKREKHIEVPSSSKRKLTQLQQDPRYLSTKFSIDDRSTTRVKHCTIIGDNRNSTTPNKMMQNIKRQDAFDVDSSIELGSIKKCWAWMDTWFKEDGTPKEATDEDNVGIENEVDILEQSQKESAIK